MSISTNTLKSSLLRVNATLNSSEIERISSKKKIAVEDVDEVIDILCRILIDNPHQVRLIRENFGFLILPIVCKFLDFPEKKESDHQVKCYVLSILAENNLQIIRYSYDFFSNHPAPFQNQFFDAELSKKKKIKLSDVLSDLDIVQMCLEYLKLDLSFYRRVWDWNLFIERFQSQGCDLQKLYFNKILALLFGMSSHQSTLLNAEISEKVYVEAEIEINHQSVECKENADQIINWKFKNDKLINIEGVYLQVYNKFISNYYNDKLDLVCVNSTNTNLRSLALGVSSGKAICLNGPVGSGKTSLVEYLAKKVGRLPPKVEDVNHFLETKKQLQAKPSAKGNNKRKIQTQNSNTGNEPDENMQSGFFRIQLGDQTDSKVLLGQYRCTDIPGEFVWQPGILTKAVMNGHWLLLEDIDSATQDVCTILTNLLENKFLRVPGFRENLKVAHGFQLFLTFRTQRNTNQSSGSAYALLEKHLYTINILPLNRVELTKVICENFPKLSTVATRIVDVFLIFSRGCHEITDCRDEDSHTSTSKDILPTVNKLTHLPNSGRMVSTRDLLKLCKRSNQSFEATSTECAFLVFQNCVDLFSSHMPAGELKTNLIISIGARLGIIETRCIHLENEFMPTISITSEEISIGRAKLKKYSIEDVNKKQKLNNEVSENVQKGRLSQPTFSFTRVSSGILEKVAMAVQQCEPVLLVGETGTGKTSSVQYLAYQTNHNLVVVNMNNQSDVSDLIGGFKPVDIGFIISPLRNEFEILFARTFDLIKNEKFLCHVSGCFNRGDFRILVKLMLKVIPNACKLTDRSNSSNDLLRWENLEKKLKKLDQQLKTSTNLAFAFMPGSLVNCIRNGDWVLLDEINLASSETLECLSTILEPDGSIILLERGDFAPVKRHSEFRIFACMNPSTDVGKKDLPVGIRNRFSEFYVDELTNEKDLRTLVGDYLNNTGIEKSRIHKAVELYVKLRSLSQLELNDGLGNKPVFSLRTLCRALKTCAKNLCGSIERNIYESFCLSFLTQLDSQSHASVLKEIQRHLVSDAKKVLSQSIPKPDGIFTNFEGYWIENGNKEPQECKEYILTESVLKNLKDLARIISIGRLPILLQGPTSAGKTSLIEFIAKRTGNNCLRINNHEHTDLQEYVGTYAADMKGKLSFQEGILVKAMRNGYWIILDELNLAPSDILEALNRVLDDNRELYIPETQTVVKAHPNFMLFATQNPPGLYGGRKTLSRAFKNRFIELHFPEIPKNELEIILEKRCLIPMKYAQKMVKTMTALQINRRTTTRNNFTLRDLFRWGNRYTYADCKLLEDRNYDWNQHLVDEGYLVLSAKVRNPIENEIIIDSLFKMFSKRISIENLFLLHVNTSLVTKDILEGLINYKGSQHVVWTFEMIRMAVLVSKSLQFNEPVLLVGPTGCGKTTVCQLLAELKKKNLRMLNCHMHTESADFLGGLRPCRVSKEENNAVHLFEWSDGPLVCSMQEGSFFLADEISLAEDSVLERLNCVLEPERTLLLAEKSGSDDSIIHGSEFIVKATDGFQFLATMNPGGDFGKKELSPALRNRFTEIWCTANYSDEDLTKIAMNSLRLAYDIDHKDIEKIASVIVATVGRLKQVVEKLNFSIRDVLAWVNYITKNHNVRQSDQSRLNLNEAFFYGLHTIFLDSLEMLPFENFTEIFVIRTEIVNELQKNIDKVFNRKVNFSTLSKVETKEVEIGEQRFGINPFYLETVDTSNISKSKAFSFAAPTTKRNLFRLLSALSLKKAILLEGPPGVGKSSLVENIALTIGYNLVRINLCEHTDIADLFGTDLPAENSIFDNENNELQLGSFIWRDGPLLAALKAPNTWILLDELNLAPQSVLEGLNAILDHRGEVYIPELNKTFYLGQQTRIFATQNPLRQGGGRKGLPQSFLNRFTKVYLKKLEKEDLLHVVRHNFDVLENIEMLRNVGLLEKMVTFSERIEMGISNMEFGYKGGPYEANLRDMLRWCELLTNEKTGYNFKKFTNSESTLDDFLLVLFEKMSLVYCQRMRTDTDVQYIVNIFEEIFKVDTSRLQEISTDISLFWNDTDIFFNDFKWSKGGSNESHFSHLLKSEKSIILSSQLTHLKNLTECVMLNKPVIFCGPTDSGKTKTINAFCEIFNKELFLDTIDDSVTGSFQQFDFNRMLEELWQHVEETLFKKLREAILSRQWGKNEFSKLLRQWRAYDLKTEKLSGSEDEKTTEVNQLCDRLEIIKDILEELTKICINEEKFDLIQMTGNVKTWQIFLEKSFAVLNTGGHFEWIDSVIVKSIKFGHFICLEHVNLVSSAILDRLNPIMEPHGTLLISEKGVAANGQPETISKHPNCQIFLTIDPKYGEISRPMRNRCIELSISHQNYTEDDLRKLIYIQGVHEMYLVKAIVSIHKSLCNVSEFSCFGVSHVTKMAFLVAQNKTMGIDYSKCLLMSAMEVYVRSSSLDLLGFGLDYYKMKLKENIVTIVEIIKPSANVINYDNLILHSNELTIMKMIKLQAESFFALLMAQKMNLNANEVLNDLHTMLKEVDFDDIGKFAKYMLTFLYMMSSFSDARLRKIYLEQTMSKLDCTDLINLNERLYNVVAKFSSGEVQDVPWNSKIYSRLRTYDTSKLQISQEFVIIISLLLESTINEVTTKTCVSLKNIDAISYSKAIQSKELTDTINNKMIRELHKLLATFKCFASSTLNMLVNNLDEKVFLKLLTSFLWFNRLLDISKKRLFIHNNVTADFLDELHLHFKWFNKNCVSQLSCDATSKHQFMKTFNDIQNFIISQHHSLQLYKKIYVLEFTSFQPLFDEEQVKRFKELEYLCSLVTITPKMNELCEFEEYKKRLTLIMSTSYQDFRRQIYFNCNSHVNDSLNAFSQLWNGVMRASDLNSVLIGQFDSYQLNDSFLNRLNQRLQDFEEFLCMENICVDLRNTKYGIETLPILEYFVIKALPLAINSQCVVNEEFILNVQSLDSNVLLLTKILNDPRYEILNKISKTEQNLPKEFNKVYSSFVTVIESEIQKAIQKSLVVNSHLCRSYDNEEFYLTKEILPYTNGALLTHNMISLLMDKSGDVRQTGLGEVKQWIRTLSNLKSLMWLNAEVNERKYNLLDNALVKNEKNATNMIDEIIIVKSKCLSIENENFSDFNKDFWRVIDKLKVVLLSDNTWLKNYLLESLTGVIKLNLLTYFPLIDPVKKNRLKTAYIEDDVAHLNQLLLSYKFMSIILNYNDLGRDQQKLLEKEIEALRNKLLKRSRKVAIRPERCIYSLMVQNVNHFLSSCCHPKQLSDIIIATNEILTIKQTTVNHKKFANIKNELEELISKINLWIINADKFTNHTMRQYNAYYREFMLPIECSITLLKNGFLGLKSLLHKKHDSLEFGEHEKLGNVMKNLIEFPMLARRETKYNIFSLVNNVEENEAIFFELIKSQICQTKNQTSIAAQNIDLEVFRKFDTILNYCNQLWQKQEELKRKKQMDEDSLYVTKTKCAEEDDKIVIACEISQIFPESTENDFIEFMQQETLEQVVKNEKMSHGKNEEIIKVDDYKLIAKFFNSFLNEDLSSTRDYVEMFEHKLKVFSTLFDRLKNCFDCTLDNSSYRSFSLLIALCQENFSEKTIRVPTSKPYNFYKDSNISEAMSCISVMKKLEKRVREELEQWPDHAVLNDLIIIMDRIRGFPSSSPLVRYNVGMQILRKKVNEWNSMAHRLNNFKELECEIADIVQKWMQMELQCWRESLNQSFENVKGKAYRYWFFLYNLIHEFLGDESNTDSESESSLVDIKKVEKIFAIGDYTDEEKMKKGKVSIEAATKVLKQFIESANYAEFQVRLNLLKSFEIYLIWLNKCSTKSLTINMLIALLHNIHQYYSQFSQKVQENIELVRKPIEDKLRKFVKINSFNKDLSYFSTEANIKQVHRNLHKFIKEFEAEVTKKIVDQFTYKDADSELDSNQYKNVGKPKIALIPDSFVIRAHIEVSEKTDLAAEILSGINKYISKSRIIVKNSISNVPYTNLIMALNDLIEDKLETCNHLRSLKVDENLPRSKQKSQAKSILNQKRKALTDFFKTITSIGVNYKTGLLTNMLHSEIIDLQIPPFALEKLKFSDTDVKDIVTEANNKLDTYFSKSIFKIKLLINLLLTPRSDIDYSFLERIKGYAIDLFTLVQDQRKNLSENVNRFIEFKNHLHDLEIVKTSEKLISYKMELKKFHLLKEGFIHTTEVLEQFKILLKCAPDNDNVQELKVIISTNNTLHKKNQNYLTISTKLDKLLTAINENILLMVANDSIFIDKNDYFWTEFKKMTFKMSELKELFVVDSHYSTFGEPIYELCTYLQKQLDLLNVCNKDQIQNPPNIEEDLAKLSHTVLLVFQNIYKHYQDPMKSVDLLIEENHLKEKMFKNIARDIDILQLKKVNTLLTDILNSSFIATSVVNAKLFACVSPLLEQYCLLYDFFIVQQICAHKSSVKMLSIMLSVFLELTKNGFCVPENLLSDEEQKQEGDRKTGDGFGFEDGEGEKDVSDKLESEDQLDEAKKPEDYNNKNEQDQKDCKEEKGIDMSENFEGQMHDVDQNDSQSESDNDEVDKEMGETKEGADKLDDQIWGDDENEKAEKEQDMQEEEGKGSGEKEEKHNDLDAENDTKESQPTQQNQEDGLDAASRLDENEKNQEQKKDIEQMHEQGEEDEEQTNPYHNQLEEPPEPDDLNLDNDFNLDNNEKDEKELDNEENPHDVDTMKEKSENIEDVNENENQNSKEKESEDKSDAGDSSDDDEFEKEKFDDQEKDMGQEEEDEENYDESALHQPDTLENTAYDDNLTEDQKEPSEDPNDYHESKDQTSREQNIQSMPNQKDKSSHDQVQTELTEESTQQDTEFDDQDTGEDKDGVGQAENQESNSGHQGVSDAKEKRSKKNNNQDETQQKRKKGNTDEERTLGDVDKMDKKILKTVDSINRDQNDDPPDVDENRDDNEEYQHVKDAKMNDKTTFDNATEEQSNKIQHEDNAEEKTESKEEPTDDLMEIDERPEPQMMETDKITNDKLNEKSEKPSRQDERLNDCGEKPEDVEINGENMLTSSVARGNETTAHCQMDILNDETLCEEQSNTEMLEIRRLVESEITAQRISKPEASDMEKWQEVSNRMMSNARELCEQLRLILEPTKCTRLKGDYRTGRRINMKKIIPYIASQFRKDKIWLRRTKASQRDYKITIAVDDSKSMDHNNSKELTLQTISLVSQALTLLESGKLSVVSFGESSKIILKYNEQFNGPNLIKSLNFDQNKTRIAELLDFTRVMNQEDSSTDSSSLFEQLLIILSDGRNIFAEGEQKVRNAIKMARLQRMFLIYIIFDNPSNQHSILDIQRVEFNTKEKKTKIVSYMDQFPFPYFVIVRDLNQLPLVLSEGLRQWFELVNSEQ